MGSNMHHDARSIRPTSDEPTLRGCVAALPHVSRPAGVKRPANEHTFRTGVGHRNCIDERLTASPETLPAQVRHSTCRALPARCPLPARVEHCARFHEELAFWVPQDIEFFWQQEDLSQLDAVLADEGEAQLQDASEPRAPRQRPSTGATRALQDTV